MAEINMRRTGEFMKALFKLLMANPEGVQAGTALKQLASGVALSPHEAGTYSDGSLRFDKIVRFATVDCSKAGWLVKAKGTWSVTDEGRAAYTKYTDPEAFYREARRLYGQWKRGQEAESEVATDGPEDVNGSKAAAITFEQAQEQAWAEIEQYLRTMNPYDFQQLVADLLRAMGYYVSWVSPPGKDGGMDIVAFTDPLGTKPPRIKVQVKRRQERVDTDGLKSFLAIINDGDVGIYMSAGGFTKDAEAFARQQESRRITLIDLERLYELWIEHFAKLDDAAQRRFPLTPIYFLTPDD